MTRAILTILLILASGYARAQTDPDSDFQRGFSATQEGNYTLAATYYLAAAEQGHVKAQHNVGIIYA